MKMFPSAAIAALLLAMPIAAQAPDNREVIAVAHAFEEAQQKGDRAALERLIDPDFLYVGTNGRLGGKQDFITGFTAPGHVLEPYRILDPLFIRASGDVAIVGGEAWLRGKDGGTTFVEHFRYADTFARRGGRWVAVYTQITALPAR